jgi:hypothetical protein
MQFIDRTKIIVKAGDGGHGKSAFRREKFIPKERKNLFCLPVSVFFINEKSSYN